MRRGAAAAAARGWCPREALVGQRPAAAQGSSPARRTPASGAPDDLDRLRAADDLDVVAVLALCPGRRQEGRLAAALAERRPVEDQTHGPALDLDPDADVARPLDPDRPGAAHEPQRNLAARHAQLDLDPLRPADELELPDIDRAEVGRERLDATDDLDGPRDRLGQGKRCGS